MQRRGPRTWVEKFECVVFVVKAHITWYEQCLTCSAPSSQRLPEAPSSRGRTKTARPPSTSSTSRASPSSALLLAASPSPSAETRAPGPTGASSSTRAATGRRATRGASDRTPQTRVSRENLNCGKSISSSKCQNSIERHRALQLVLPWPRVPVLPHLPHRRQVLPRLLRRRRRVPLRVHLPVRHAGADRHAPGGQRAQLPLPRVHHRGGVGAAGGGVEEGQVRGDRGRGGPAKHGEGVREERDQVRYV